MLFSPPHIPTESECLTLMARHKMLPNIKDHSILVARVAEFITRGLNKRGHSLSLETSRAGGLLHDIGKSLCLDNDQDHARVGMDICLEHGLTQIAPIVAEHVMLTDYTPEKILDEIIIVNYSDKRVLHDEVVLLSERLEYILEKYGGDNPMRHDAIKKNYQICQQIEQRIFAELDCSPEDMKNHIAR